MRSSVAAMQPTCVGPRGVVVRPVGRGPGHANARCERALAAGRGQRAQRFVRQAIAEQQALGTEGTTDEGADRITAWAAEAGIECGKLVLSDFEATGRGMRATADVAKDEIVVAIPRKIALQIAPTKPCPFDDVDKDFWKRKPWYVKMGILIVKEKMAGQASVSAEYIRQLPQEFDTLMNWNEDELKVLQFPHVVEAMRKQVEEWDQHHADLMASSPGCGISRDDLVWAMSCARSRAFSGPYIGSSAADRLRLAGVVTILAGANIALNITDMITTLNAAISVMLFNIIYEISMSGKLRQYTMAPVIDFMNHKTTMNSEVTYDVFADTFSVASGKDFKQGEEVFISYGVQTGDSLIQYYGFLEDGNPNDRFAWNGFWDKLRVSGSLSDGRFAEVLEMADLDVSEPVAVNSYARVRPPVRAALRYACAESMPAHADKTLAQCSEAQGDDLESAVWDLLGTLARTELSLLPTSIADDEAALKKSGMMSYRKSLAIRYNLSRKVLLQKFINTWKKYSKEGSS